MAATLLWRSIVIGCFVFQTVVAIADDNDDSAKVKSGPLGASSDQLEADVRFLASDLLEGREAGTPGYDVAALYVAERFRGLGLEPGGDGDTFYQSVPMLEYEIEGHASLAIDGMDLVLNEDYLMFPSRKGEKIDFSAPLVFGGICFASERHNRDDLAGLDLDGKIVACMDGAPKDVSSEESAHFSTTQLKRASKLGAIGDIWIYTPTNEAVFPFARFAEIMKTQSNMTWLDQDGTPFSLAPNIKASVLLSLAGADKLFSKLGHSWDEIISASESESADVARFDMGINARIQVQSRYRVLESDNVVAILPGSDPVLADEYVVLTAHLDHDGIRATPDEDDDELYNGAMDNATGVSALLEVARLLKAFPPKRSVVFIAVTAEEKGYNGSDYFARNPTVPADKMVAVVNLDTPIMTYEFTDVVAFGAERSTLYPAVKQAVEAHGLALSPDPAPEQNLFVRSDHYMFVKQGVPAVYLSPGFANGGEEAQTAFRTTHYHQASDEADLINFDALRRFTDVKADIARNIADMPERPVWNAGDFFGTTFDGPMAGE